MTLYVVKSLDSLKSLNEGSESFYVINVNGWFESHGFSHKDMNPVREWIFVEWMNKKISSYSSKKTREEYICILFSETTNTFIKNLSKNLSIHFEWENLEFVYIR